MAQPWPSSTSESGILRKNKVKDKFEDLLVFGYACKLFRDDEKALHVDQGKHLIPWMGDEKQKIDRYDCRGHLSDLKPYEASREGYDAMRWLGLSESDRKLEQLCDDERYYSLKINEEEEELYKEEEEKRKKTNEFAYSYDVPGDPESSQEGIPTVPEANPEDEDYIAPVELDVPVDIELPKTVKESTRIEKTALFVSQQGMQMEILLKTKQGDNPQFGFLNQNDPLFKFYRHVLSAIKNGRYKPQSQKLIDENAEDAAQDRANDGHYLHPSLVATTTQPDTQTQASVIPSIPYKPSANCTYSQLVNRIQGNPLEPPVEQPQPVPDIQATFAQLTLEQQQQYYQYYYAAQYYEYYKQVAQYQQSCGQQGENVPMPEVPLDANMQHYLQQMAYAQYVQHHQQHQQQQQQSQQQQQQQQPSNSYAQIVSNVKDTSNPYAALLANLQQSASTSGVAPLGPLQGPGQAGAGPPQPSAADHQSRNSPVPQKVAVETPPPSFPAPVIIGDGRDTSATVAAPLAALTAYGSDSGSNDSDSDSADSDTSKTSAPEEEEGEEEFKVPTGETQVVIDKMASYVSKNGIQFEEIVKAKGDPRFVFLNEDHDYHKYYRHKIAELKGEKKKPSEGKKKKEENKEKKQSGGTLSTLKKEKKVIAPVSFSIKKPKEDTPKEIKSALPMEESEDEEEVNAAATTAATKATTTTTSTKATVAPSLSAVLSAEIITKTITSLPIVISSDKVVKSASEKVETVKEPPSEKTKPTETTKEQPLSTVLLNQCMKKNGVLDNDDPILEMIDLTDDAEERKDAKRAQDRIKDKLVAAAREKLALAAKDRALQLERKKKAAAFLKLKSILNSSVEQQAASGGGKDTTTGSKDSSRRSSTDGEAKDRSKEVSRGQSREKSREKSGEKCREEVYDKDRDRKERIVEMHSSDKVRDKRREVDGSLDREVTVVSSRKRCREKRHSRPRDKDRSRKKTKHGKSNDCDQAIVKDEQSSVVVEDCTYSPKRVEVVQIVDSDSEEGEIKKKKKASKKKKAHKRKHSKSKHDSRSKKKSKKKHRRSDSSSSEDSS